MDESARTYHEHPADPSVGLPSGPLADPAGEGSVGPRVGRRSDDQPPLPFDDEVHEPIAYVLTARARRTVAPDSLPPLRVVDESGHTRHTGGTGVDPSDGELERRGDTRPARARALRRAGVGVAQIARQLGVDDDLVVRAWVADVSRSPRNRRRPVAPVPAEASVPASVPMPRRGEGAARVGPWGATRSPHRRASELSAVRARASAEARRRLACDPAFAAGVGLLAGLAGVDDHTVTVCTDDLAIARRVVRWLRQAVAADPAIVRVVVRLGPRASGDVVRHRWATALEVPVQQIAHAPWRAAPAPDAVEAIVRVADPQVAATVAGWRDAFLAPELPDGSPF